MIKQLFVSIMLLFGALYIIDFIAAHPSIIEKIDSTADMAKDKIGEHLWELWSFY